MLLPPIHQMPIMGILKPNCSFQARATQLTADNSRRAGELELERIRREHEENQVSLWLWMDRKNGRAAGKAT